MNAPEFTTETGKQAFGAANKLQLFWCSIFPLFGDYKIKQSPSAFLEHSIVVSIPTTPYARAFPWPKTRAEAS